jgi:hypothetical protein
MNKIPKCRSAKSAESQCINPGLWPSVRLVLASAVLALALARGATFTTTGALVDARSGHRATLLRDGTVLVLGGRIATAELYDPAAAAWTSTSSLAIGRTVPTATLLSDGRVLVAGGHTTDTNSTGGV